MSISSLATVSSKPETQHTNTQAQQAKAAEISSANTKKDTLYLSEAAKDLAAQQVGQEAKEEATETYTSTLKEGGLSK